MASRIQESPLKLEFNLGRFKDRAAARRQALMLEAAPQIEMLRRKLTKDARLGLDDVDTKTAKAALAFYNNVVTDGRYVKLMKSRPQAAAAKLGLTITEAVADAITRIVKRIGPGPAEGPVEAVIAIAVVVVWFHENPAAGVVIEDQAKVRPGRL